MRTLTLLLASALIAAAADVPAEGTKAPDFTLKSQEGTPVSLHDYQGKWVVLYFYPKDQTLHHRGAQLPARSAQI